MSEQKNPLFTEGFYFFSGMYDDSVISDFFRKTMSETYDCAASYQQNMISRVRDQYSGRIVYTANASDFVIDPTYNAKIGVNKKSYSVKIPRLIIPYHNKKLFIATYGYDYAKIPLMDFFTRSDIFDKYPAIYVGDYRIMSKAYLVLNRDRSVTLVIEEDGTVTPFKASELIASLGNNDPILVFMNESARVYHYTNNTRTSNPFTNSTSAGDNAYFITIPYENTTVDRKAVRSQYTSNNSWDIIIVGTNSEQKYYSPVIVGSFVNESEEQNQVRFIISGTALSSLQDELFASAFRYPFDIWFIERPFRRDIYIYNYDASTDPIMNLGYNENPAGNINIEIYECNDAYVKGRRLYDANLVQLYFPSIFDFTSLNTRNSNLLIEVIEYPSSYTNQKMHNSLQPLFDSVGEDFYTEMTVNGYDVRSDESRAGLHTFRPTHHSMIFEDYLASPYYHDIRGYLLDKLVKTFETDPWLISYYYDLLSTKNRRVVSKSGTPRLYGLTIEGTADGEYAAETEVVTDTSIASQNEDDILYFSEPHTYIKYQSNLNKTPAMIYFNGQYVKPTTTRFHAGYNYYFIPTARVAQMKTETNAGASAADIQSHSSLIVESCAPVTIDIYPDAYESIVDTPKDQFSVQSIDDKIRIFQDLENPFISLDQLVFYNHVTGELINDWENHFDVVLELASVRYRAGEDAELIKVEAGTAYSYLITVLNELYTTNNEQAILLKSTPTLLSLQDTVEETNIPAKYLMTKKLNFMNVYFVPTDVSFLGMQIGVRLNSFKHEISFSGSDFTHTTGRGYSLIIEGGHKDYLYYDADTLSDLLTYYNDVIQISSSVIGRACRNVSHLKNYMVFLNGRYLKDAVMIPTSMKYGGDIQLLIPNTIALQSSDVITYVHLPTRYHDAAYSLGSNVRYMKPGLTSQRTINTIWPEENDYQHGIALNGSLSDIYPRYPVENVENIEFTANGYRLPPMSTTTMDMTHIFFNPNRAKYMTSLIKADLSHGNGTLLTLPCMIPIIDWSSVNSYDVLHRFW